ncbi:hypothetical protein ACE6H2_007123 [Prunus campanulata]
MMTVKQIQYNPEAKYIGFHGVLAPGTLENYVKSEGRKTYNLVEEFNDALSRGSKNGGATAVIDEIPYIKSFLAKYSASYSMIKPKPITNGFGFVLNQTIEKQKLSWSLVYMGFQGKKQTILCLSFVTLFSLLGLCSPNIVVEEVHVSVILDMGSREGKIILSCISTALSDFYHLHDNYSTRVILHTRDSKGKALHALSAALNLLDKIKVEAIIGAQTRMEANLLAELGEEAKVPVLSLSGLRTSPFGAPGEYPFFVEITQDETSQVTAISGLIEMFKWRDVILLYENTDYGRDIIPFFINSFE